MKIVKQDCNLSIRRGWEWIEKTDRWLWDLRQDGGKSVGYNCCHPSQVCPGTLAYIHTLLLEDKTKGSTSPLPSIHHPPFTSFCTHLLHIFLNRYGEKGLPVALYVLEDCAEDPVQVHFLKSVFKSVCCFRVTVSSVQLLCLCTPLLWGWQGQWRYPVPTTQ